MKAWTTLLFLTVVLGWSTANAGYDPDNYFYTNVSLGYNSGNDWSEQDEDWSLSEGELGSGLAIGYVTHLKWNMFGSIRYEYLSQKPYRFDTRDDESYLATWGVTAEWRWSVDEYNPDSYWYAMLYYGKNNGKHWDDAGQNGTGFGAGYTRRLFKTVDIFGSVRYSHYSQLAVGEPFDNNYESHLDHIGVVAELRF